MHTIENLPTFLSISSKHIKLCSYLCHFRFSFFGTNKPDSVQTEKKKSPGTKTKTLVKKRERRKWRIKKEKKNQKRLSSRLWFFCVGRFSACWSGSISTFASKVTTTNLLLTKVITEVCANRNVCVCCIFFSFSYTWIEASEFIFRKRVAWFMGFCVVGLCVQCVGRLIKGFEINYYSYPIRFYWIGYFL